MVDRDRQELTVRYDVSEKAKLECGPAKLAIESSLRQRCLFHCDADEGRSVGVELVGHRAQKCLAPTEWMRRDLDCNPRRSLTAPSDLGERGLLEVDLTSPSGRRIQTDYMCHRPALSTLACNGPVRDEAPQSS